MGVPSGSSPRDGDCIVFHETGVVTLPTQSRDDYAAGHFVSNCPHNSTICAGSVNSTFPATPQANESGSLHLVRTVQQNAQSLGIVARHRRAQKHSGLKISNVALEY